MAEPLVSVIIPVYNRASFIEETLNSVKAQSYENWECILVDDHSTDESWKLLKEFENLDSRFKAFKRPKNRIKGANACRNFGFEKSQGEYINWFDSDDLMESSFLQNKIEKHLNSDYDFVLSKTNISNLGSKLMKKELRTKLSKNLLEDFLTYKITWYLPDPMFRKSFLDGKLLFDESLLGGQDRDFFRRVLLFKPRIAVIEDYSRIYLLHKDSISELIYRKQSPEVLISIFKSLISYIDVLYEKKMLKIKLRKFYFKELIKYTPFIYKDILLLKKLKASLLKIQVFDLENYNLWIKYYLGLISLKITGKGQKLFK